MRDQRAAAKKAWATRRAAARPGGAIKAAAARNRAAVGRVAIAARAVRKVAPLPEAQRQAIAARELAAAVARSHAMAAFFGKKRT